MRMIALLFVCLFLTGCPVYDPPSGILEISNRTKSVVYVYLTCTETLPCDPPLKLYWSIGDSVFDANGNKIANDSIRPPYGIEANSKNILSVWGSPEKPRVPCEDGKMLIFFIKEKTMLASSWETICKGQLFEDKLIVTQHHLDSLGWKITYKKPI